MTFEEGTSAAWLYDLLKPRIANVLVCAPRKNALLEDGSKNDRIDARKLAELLRGNHLSPIYHKENGLRTLETKPEQTLWSDRGSYLQTVGGYRDKNSLGYQPKEEVFLLTSPLKKLL